jgi:hypothetical protein
MPPETATQVQILALDETDPTALYRHYGGQDGPQDCFISLDLRDGELTADWNGEIGNSVPESVWHGQVLRWGIPCLTSKAANLFLTEIAPIAQRILDGAEIVWDDHNNVGRLDEQAQTASEEIAAMCEDLAGVDGGGYARIVEFDAADWYSEGEPPAVRAAMTDDELEALAEQLQADDAGTGTDQNFTDNPGDYVILAGLDEYLERLRENAREVVEEELAEAGEDVEEAVARRDNLIRAITWRSSREVGNLARLSHTRVQQIAAKTDA